MSSINRGYSPFFTLKISIPRNWRFIWWMMNLVLAVQQNVAEGCHNELTWTLFHAFYWHCFQSFCYETFKPKPNTKTAKLYVFTNILCLFWSICLYTVYKARNLLLAFLHICITWYSKFSHRQYEHLEFWFCQTLKSLHFKFEFLLE